MFRPHRFQHLCGNIFISMIRLKHLLAEIGEATATPYEHSYNKHLGESYFTTEDGTQYKVTFHTFKQTMEIAFGVVVGLGDRMDYEIEPNKGNLYRVMSTVIKIVRQAIYDIKPKQITFGVSKSDPRRMKMYKKYIINNLKGYSVIKDDNSILVLQRDGASITRFDWTGIKDKI